MLQIGTQNEGKLFDVYLRACLLTINSVYFTKFPDSSSFSVFFLILIFEGLTINYLNISFGINVAVVCAMHISGVFNLIL